jgi:hypothetical protein
MKRNFFIQLFKRYASKNPKFWRIIMISAIITFGIVAAILGLHKYEIIHLPDNWFNLLTHIDAFFAGVFLTSGAGTSDPLLLDDATIDAVKSDNTLR